MCNIHSTQFPRVVFGGRTRINPKAMPVRWLSVGMGRKMETLTRYMGPMFRFIEEAISQRPENMRAGCLQTLHEPDGFWFSIYCCVRGTMQTGISKSGTEQARSWLFQ